MTGALEIETFKCISPIDGSVYAERPLINRTEAAGLAASARQAQKSWAARPMDDRIKLVKAGIARLGDMNDEIVPELAHMMGRPVRYGGEFSGVDELTGRSAQIHTPITDNRWKVK